jgi:uridine kinase
MKLLTTKPFLIGITGGSGSGKTTFIRHLRERFTEAEVCVLSQDNYYLPQAEQQCDEKGFFNFDLPKAIDKQAFVQDLQQLLDGKIVQRSEYVFEREDMEPQLLTYQPAPVIIVEGIFVLHFKKIRELLDLKIYLHAKENLKVIRRILRDQQERDYPLEVTLHRYENHVLPAFEKYIEPYKEQADMVINNNQHFTTALEVVAGFIRDKTLDNRR